MARRFSRLSELILSLAVAIDAGLLAVRGDYMSVWEKVKSWFGAVTGSGQAVCIVDAAHLGGLGKPNGRLNPKEQIQILRKLSQFAEREGLDVAVVFEGHALREVAHGEAFGAKVKVYFADSAAGVQDIIRKLVADERSRSPLVVTANRKFEEELAAIGARLMRGNTLRKGIDLALTGGGGEQQTQRQNGRRSRERRRRHQGGQGGSGSPATTGGSSQKPADSAVRTDTTQATAPTGSAPAPSQNQSAQKPPVDDAVRDLIDLVE